MRNTKDWPESFALPLPIMWIILGFPHLGFQITQSWLYKLPSFRILDTACLYLRHVVSTNKPNYRRRKQQEDGTHRCSPPQDGLKSTQAARRAN